MGSIVSVTYGPGPFTVKTIDPIVITVRIQAVANTPPMMLLTPEVATFMIPPVKVITEYVGVPRTFDVDDKVSYNDEI